MKPVEIVLRRGEEEGKRWGKSKIYCKHICKYNNVSPIPRLFILINLKM
jgi:hypothetical protein